MFDERERVAIAWADRVTRNEAHADAALWDRVRASFDEGLPSSWVEAFAGQAQEPG